MVRVVRLCKDCSCCPEVRIYDERVEVGEKDNLCTLTKEEWELLKQKITDKEL